LFFKPILELLAVHFSVYKQKCCFLDFIVEIVITINSTFIRDKYFIKYRDVKDQLDIVFFVLLTGYNN